ncbi:MAG: hypothetical protein WB611_31375 [Stellaceae bacterium]
MIDSRFAVMSCRSDMGRAAQLGHKSRDCRITESFMPFRAIDLRFRVSGS